MRAYPDPGDDVSTPDAARAAAATTYNAAADSYDDPANSFWERFGSETVDRLGLQPGARVLNVCCVREVRPDLLQGVQPVGSHRGPSGSARAPARRRHRTRRDR